MSKTRPHDAIVAAFKALGATSATLSGGRTRIHGPNDAAVYCRKSRTHFCNVERNGSVSISREYPKFANYHLAEQISGNTGRFVTRISIQTLLVRWGSASAFANDVVQFLKDTGDWERLGSGALTMATQKKLATKPAGKKRKRTKRTKFEMNLEDWHHLHRFIGYGARDARTWFIGIEEGGTLSYRELRIRRDFSQFEDLRKATIELGAGHFFEGAKNLQSTWSVLVKTLLFVSKRPSEPAVASPRGDDSGAKDLISPKERAENREAAREFQATELGRSIGTTCLTELLPLPARRNSAWPYKSGPGTPFLSKRRTYEDEAIGTRTRQLERILRECEPKLVWCYGSPSSYWPHFEKLFEVEAWTNHLLQAKSNNDADFVRWAKTSWGGLAILTLHPTAHGMNAWDRIRRLAEFIRERLAENERALPQTLTK